MIWVGLWNLFLILSDGRRRPKHPMFEGLSGALFVYAGIEGQIEVANAVCQGLKDGD